MTSGFIPFSSISLNWSLSVISFVKSARKYGLCAANNARCTLQWKKREHFQLMKPKSDYSWYCLIFPTSFARVRGSWLKHRTIPEFPVYQSFILQLSTSLERITKYQGAKEFHMLVRIGCYCKIMVFSPFKVLVTHHHSSEHNQWWRPF